MLGMGIATDKLAPAVRRPDTPSFLSGVERRQGHWGGRRVQSGAALGDAASFGSGGGGAGAIVSASS